jgi:hypothetical protein
MLASLKGMLGALRPGGRCRIAWTDPAVWGRRGETSVIPPSPAVEQVGRGSRRIAFEVWDVGERCVTQTLFRLNERRGVWGLETMRCRLRLLTPETMQRLMARAGFADVQIQSGRQSHVAWGTRPGQDGRHMCSTAGRRQ